MLALGSDGTALSGQVIMIFKRPFMDRCKTVDSASRQKLFVVKHPSIGILTYTTEAAEKGLMSSSEVPHSCSIHSLYRFLLMTRLASTLGKYGMTQQGLAVTAKGVP
jgi:hypothetical protein